MGGEKYTRLIKGYQSLYQHANQGSEVMVHDYRRCHDHGSRRYIFGTVKVGERGQIVIPKDARETFDIKPGDTLMILGHEGRGLAVVKADKFQRIAEEMLRIFEAESEEPLEE